MWGKTCIINFPDLGIRYGLGKNGENSFSVIERGAREADSENNGKHLEQTAPFDWSQVLT